MLGGWIFKFKGISQFITHISETEFQETLRPSRTYSAQSRYEGSQTKQRLLAELSCFLLPWQTTHHCIVSLTKSVGFTYHKVFIPQRILHTVPISIAPSCSPLFCIFILQWEFNQCRQKFMLNSFHGFSFPD